MKNDMDKSPKSPKKHRFNKLNYPLKKKIKKEDDYDKIINLFLINKYVAMSSMNYLDEEYELFNAKQEEKSKKKSIIKKSFKVSRHLISGNSQSKLMSDMLILNSESNISNSQNLNENILTPTPNRYLHFSAKLNGINKINNSILQLPPSY